MTQTTVYRPLAKIDMRTLMACVHRNKLGKLPEAVSKRLDNELAWRRYEERRAKAMEQN